MFQDWYHNSEMWVIDTKTADSLELEKLTDKSELQKRISFFPPSVGT